MVRPWTGLDTAHETIMESSKADMLASTLCEATRLSIEAVQPLLADSLDAGSEGDDETAAKLIRSISRSAFNLSRPFLAI
jgi:hypothetical protein